MKNPTDTQIINFLNKEKAFIGYYPISRIWKININRYGEEEGETLRQTAITLMNAHGCKASKRK